MVDTRFLLKHYSGFHKSEILKLADMIENALEENTLGTNRGAALADGWKP